MKWQRQKVCERAIHLITSLSKQPADLTFSSDGTTHQHTNYESRTVALQSDETGSPNLRTLGVDSSVNHSSETQLKDLQNRLTECAQIFNASPLAQWEATSFSQEDFIAKLHGTNGDHAADQKKDNALLRAWKEDERNQ